MDVQVRFKFGHKALKNIKPTIEGYTHDWTVFVQGVDGNEIKHFVEKVVFHLPDSYSNPKQIKEKPPFCLSESTSKGFPMQIEIFFYPGSKLNKVSYIYDLFISEEEVNHSWERILTFTKPSQEFMKKLLLAGGKVVDPKKKSNVNNTLIKCKVEPKEEEIEIIKEINTVGALNSSVKKIDNLQKESSVENHDLSRLNELIKENEDLKSANAKVKENTKHQEKLLSKYEKQFSAYEAVISDSYKLINQLKEKIELGEAEISTLKAQMQMFQKEFPLIQSQAREDSEQVKPGRKRKRRNKQKINVSENVKKKREDVIEPRKVTISPSENGCSTSQNHSMLQEFLVSTTSQNAVATKRNSSIPWNRSTSKRNNFVEAAKKVTKSSTSIACNSSITKGDSFFNVAKTTESVANQSSTSTACNSSITKGVTFIDLTKETMKPFATEGSSSIVENSSTSKLVNVTKKATESSSSIACSSSIRKGDTSFNVANIATTSVAAESGSSTIFNTSISKGDTCFNVAKTATENSTLNLSNSSISNGDPFFKVTKKAPESSPIACNSSTSKLDIFFNVTKKATESSSSVACNSSISKGDTFFNVTKKATTSVAAESSSSITLNTSGIKGDTFFNVTKNQSSEKLFQSNGEIQSANTSFQLNVFRQSNQETLDSHKTIAPVVFAFKSTNTNGEEPMAGESNDKSQVRKSDSQESDCDNLMEVDPPLHVAGKSADKSVGENSPAVNVALSNCKIAGIVAPECGSSLKVNSPSSELEIRNGDSEEHTIIKFDEKQLIVNAAEAEVSQNKPKSKVPESKPETKNLNKGCVKNVAEAEVSQSKPKCKVPESKPNTKSVNKTKHVCDNSDEVSSLCTAGTSNSEIVEHMEVNSISVIVAPNKPDIKNGDIQEPARKNLDIKPLAGNRSEASTSLNESETRNVGLEQPIEKDSVTVNAFVNKPETKNGDIEKHLKSNDGKKTLVESSTEIPPKRFKASNVDEKNLVTVKVTTPLIKCEINDHDSVKITERNSSEGSTSSCAEPLKCLKKESVDVSVTKEHSSPIETVGNSNCNETGQKHSNADDEFFSLTTSKTNFPRRAKDQEANSDYLDKFCEDFSSDTNWVDSPQQLTDSAAPNLIKLVSVHYPKIAAELDRLENSKFRKLTRKTNPLIYKLGNIDSHITDAYFLRYIRSVTDFLTNPKTSYDVATVVYLVVDYLSASRKNYKNLPTFLRNGEVHTLLPKSERCLVSVICNIEAKSTSGLRGLLRSILHVIHRVLISKKKMPLSGLAALCRVSMEICRRCNDRWEPLFLCCETLRVGHPLAPWLINMLAGVWRDPFYLYNQFAVEERILLGSIVHGMREKPLLMDPDTWRLTCSFSCTFFPYPIRVDPDETIRLLTTRILSRCSEGLFEELWMLTSPLLIFVSSKPLDYKMCFRNQFILSNMHYFSRCLNERAFELFCNLYVELCGFCHESAVEDLLQFFDNQTAPGGSSVVQDCAAVALLKHMNTTNEPIPAPLRNWFLRNIDNPKLMGIADLYCKKVMESQEALLVWDDVILL